MKSSCPACGSEAKEMSQKNHTSDFVQVFFKCSNPKCGRTISGEMRLHTIKAGGEHFATQPLIDQPRIATDC